MGFELRCRRTKNKILSLADDVVNPRPANISRSTSSIWAVWACPFILREGGTLGDFYSRIDLKRDSNGAVYINEKGEIAKEPVTDVANYIKLGSVLPDANMAWRNDFRWRNFNFGFMVSAAWAAWCSRVRSPCSTTTVVSEATAAARDAGGVMINGNDLVDANKWYTAIGGGNSMPQYYTYSATNVRLQEASIGYTIPKRTLGDICEITLSLVGQPVDDLQQGSFRSRDHRYYG